MATNTLKDIKLLTQHSLLLIFYSQVCQTMLYPTSSFTTILPYTVSHYATSSINNASQNI